MLWLKGFIYFDIFLFLTVCTSIHLSLVCLRKIKKKWWKIVCKVYKVAWLRCLSSSWSSSIAYRSPLPGTRGRKGSAPPTRSLYTHIILGVLAAVLANLRRLKKFRELLEKRPKISRGTLNRIVKDIKVLDRIAGEVWPWQSYRATRCKIVRRYFTLGASWAAYVMPTGINEIREHLTRNPHSLTRNIIYRVLEGLRSYLAYSWTLQLGNRAFTWRSGGEGGWILCRRDRGAR